MPEAESRQSPKQPVAQSPKLPKEILTFPSVSNKEHERTGRPDGVCVTMASWSTSHMGG